MFTDEIHICSLTKKVQIDVGKIEIGVIFSILFYSSWADSCAECHKHQHHPGILNMANVKEIRNSLMISKGSLQLPTASGYAFRKDSRIVAKPNHLCDSSLTTSPNTPLPRI